MDEAKLKRMRNLKMFRGKSDDEIVAYLNSRPPKRVITSEEKSLADYDKIFKERMTTLQKDYGLDMNNSNDVEALRSLVRHLLQAEAVDRQIREIQNRPTIDDDDVRTLKNLGDFQRGIQTTISDLQDKLGITRKVRKEKSADDIAQYIQGIRAKAKDFWDRQTTPIVCSKCSIEMARIWINFPKIAHKYTFESECWRCKEKVIYVH
jgi:hypothetical protein